LRDTRDDAFSRWLAAAEERYLADLTRAELGRALRVLGAWYVSRPEGLAQGRALEGTGKRAAFALYYGPLHFLLVRAIAAGMPQRGTGLVVDVGCGTGVAGAAWALETGATVQGIDVNAWAVAEAVWTYRALGVSGTARRGAVADLRLPSRPATILAAFVVNELAPAHRAALLTTLHQAITRNHRVVVIEPIARTISPWWADWERALGPLGAQAREWRFPASLPPLLRDLDKAAKVTHRELTARTLST
jgi:hypothetical protein